MGYIKHHAIIVTSWDEKRIETAHTVALDTGNNVTGIVGPLTNGYCTFTIVPDGSKEGWPPSDDGDVSRHMFIEWITNNSDRLEWVYVSYGNDDWAATVVDSKWATPQREAF